jgi:hypothetical protein
MDTRKAIDILNGVIRDLHKEYSQSKSDVSILDRADKLDEVRQFLGKDL